MTENVVKLSDQELSDLLELNDRYAKIYTEIGQQTIKKEYYHKIFKEAEQQLSFLLEDFNSLETKQESIAQQLNEKYGGQGVVDLTAGTLTISQ